MKSIPVTPLTAEAARRIVWFEEPEKALADPVRFMAYAMTYARHKDMQIIRQYVSDDEFRQALDSAPPGRAGQIRPAQGIVMRKAKVAYLFRSSSPGPCGCRGR